MLRLLVLISGAGSNLLSLLEECESEGFPAEVVAVGADRSASGLDHAVRRGIPTFTVDGAGFADREAWGRELLTRIQECKPDLVILSGFMRLLPPGVVDLLAPRLINTHPAFLPEFPGAHAVRDALSAGVAQTGASIIVVDRGVDSGPVIAQERVPVEAGDSENSLHDRIKTVERRLLAHTILDIAHGVITLEELA
ncbi:MAG: phosphoribosylglycinamide formyltransferase [Microbacteriaceae bacterium]|nr:phosphoribosylglycinamide formyltransferase [Microbacteriaceae bacterium]